MQYFEISALDVTQVNDVVKSAIQEICKKMSSGYYGTFNARLWEKHGITTMGDQNKIDLSGIIDYDHQLTLPKPQIIAKSKMPVIGEEELDEDFSYSIAKFSDRTDDFDSDLMKNIQKMIDKKFD
jgi:hypothetical protein